MGVKQQNKVFSPVAPLQVLKMPLDSHCLKMLAFAYHLKSLKTTITKFSFMNAWFYTMSGPRFIVQSMVLNQTKSVSES